MGKIKTINDFLKMVLYKTQTMSEFDGFVLGGGTNLALRFDHRESIDIDLFTNKLITQEIQEKLENAIKETFKEYFPSFKTNDYSYVQSLVFRAYLIQGQNIYKPNIVKFDFIHNTPFIYPVENIKGVKMLSAKEIALMKIDSIMDRGTSKDTYDLNYLTDHIISLPELWTLYCKKRKIENKNDQNILFKKLLATKKQHTWDDMPASFKIQKGNPPIEVALRNWGYKLEDLNIDLNQGYTQSFFDF